MSTRLSANWPALRWNTVTRALQVRMPWSRSLVTVQRGPVSRQSLPQDLPPQFWSQLPTRLRPDHGKRQIVVHEPIPSRAATCKDPVLQVGNDQMPVLDPSGSRKRLFDRENREGAKVGDILHVKFKSGEAFSGVIMSVKQRGVDTSVLLRNHLTRVGAEMQIKIFSPTVQCMEVVQKTQKRKRRARLYYLRHPKHDVGSVDNVVNQYLRRRAMLTGGDSKSGSRNQSVNRK